jgi:hypothetical protein
MPDSIIFRHSPPLPGCTRADPILVEGKADTGSLPNRVINVLQNSIVFVDQIMNIETIEQFNELTKGVEEVVFSNLYDRTTFLRKRLNLVREEVKTVASGLILLQSTPFNFDNWREFWNVLMNSLSKMTAPLSYQ